jgi:transcriptional regulator with XRE-family HTH domain
MAEDVRQIVGSGIRRLRRAVGISQAELANRMGVDRAYVSGLELGQRNPTIVTLWHVAKALDVDFREIFGSSRGKPRVQKPTETKVEAKRHLSTPTRKR